MSETYSKVMEERDQLARRLDNLVFLLSSMCNNTNCQNCCFFGNCVLANICDPVWPVAWKSMSSDSELIFKMIDGCKSKENSTETI